MISGRLHPAGRYGLPDDRQRRGVPAEQLGGGDATGQDAGVAGGSAAGELARKHLVGRPGGGVGHEERMQDEGGGDRVGFFGERAAQSGDGLLWRKRLLRPARSARRPANGG